ncbi:MAG: hypothetical protein U0840_31190 [Gemmataceae bacterium]
MIGEQLHDFDICLCRHALDSIRAYLTDPEIAAYVAEQLPASVLTYLQALDDDEEAPPMLLGDQELDELSWIFTGGPFQLDQPWMPYGPLYRRGLDCVTEVREALSREHAEHWAQASARFIEQLDGDRIYLGSGIQIIREWVAEARRLLRAMGRTDLLPAPEGMYPTPTRCSCPAAPLHQPSAATPLMVVKHSAEDVDGRGAKAPPQKSSEPTRAYCLLPPNVVRWDGEIEVQQRLWHLVGVLLDKGGRATVGDIEEAVSPFKERKDKTLSNDVSVLNQQLEPIKWPFTYRRKGGFVVGDRNCPT